jgi:hypothetical protein
LDAGPYPFVWIDALSMKVRESGRICNTAVLVATACNADGHREILGLDIGSAEDGAVWTGFLRGLVARGLHGVRLVTSDAHQGLKDAIAAVLEGASWQRCRTHFMRNLLASVPRHAQPMVASLVRTIFAQERPEDAWAQLERVVAQLEQGKFADAARLLADAAGDVLAYTAFPKDTWRSTWSNNPQERLNREIRRRTEVVGIFPTAPRSSAWSARCWPSSTMSGPSPAATWAWMARRFGRCGRHRGLHRDPQSSAAGPAAGGPAGHGARRRWAPDGLPAPRAFPTAPVDAGLRDPADAADRCAVGTGLPRRRARLPADRAGLVSARTCGDRSRAPVHAHDEDDRT